MDKEQAAIKSFYESFQNLDADGMNIHYHKDATFSDPVFRNLNSSQVKAMWHMLIGKANGNLDIEFSDIHAQDGKIHAHWEAKYEFSKTKRKVHNKIDAQFEFSHGKIIRHIDHFDFWKWSSMALGPIGTVLGFTSFLKNKVRNQSMGILEKYMTKK